MCISIYCKPLSIATFLRDGIYIVINMAFQNKDIVEVKLRFLKSLSLEADLFHIRHPDLMSGANNNIKDGSSASVSHDSEPGPYKKLNRPNGI